MKSRQVFQSLQMVKQCLLVEVGTSKTGGPHVALQTLLGLERDMSGYLGGFHETPFYNIVESTFLLVKHGTLGDVPRTRKKHLRSS